MGRLFRLLVMFGPMLYRMYKKFAGNKQSNQNLPQQQNQNYGQQNRPQQQQQKDGKWDFKEGENPLG